ncbi:MAG: prepilin-type N-terminal cleavage/methylation domain-containing protein [Lachnospiraceae bacterium]|nr:prepilin-type N-terminal cleavage/methylation domain-containing protein [Lachnospiraceae bacterium]
MNKNIKLNNKGFSLVEILTALAIGSIVLLGVTAFMNGGSVSYRTATTQVALQDDVQETMNYLTDLLQRSMDVVYDEPRGILYMFMPKKDGIHNEYEVYYCIYDDTNDKLYIDQRDVISPTSYNGGLKYTTPGYTEDDLLSEGVTAFRGTVERDPTTNEVSIVHITTTFFKNNKFRSSTISIRPRNRDWVYDSTKPRFYDVIS